MKIEREQTKNELPPIPRRCAFCSTAYMPLNEDSKYCGLCKIKWFGKSWQQIPQRIQ